MNNTAQQLMNYDITKVPTLFGLQNTGNSCYLNSLIQSLISCSAFNEFILSDPNAEANKTVAELIKLLRKPASAQPKKVNVHSLITILPNLMIIKNKAFRFQMGRQEDAHEGFQLLSEAVGSRYDILFHNKYKVQVHCHNCGHDTYPKVDPCEVVIKIGQRELNSKVNIEDHIKRHIEALDDYKCDKCKIKNTQTQKYIIRVDTLSRVSEVIILLFKKYNEKSNIYFPTSLDFKGTAKNTLHYEMVAQIEHYGSMYGGHYTARCLRPKPDGFHEYRMEQSQKVIANCGSIPQYKNRVDMAKVMMQHDTNNIKTGNNLGVFMFNDGSVRYLPDGFYPTPETYIVMYHLFDDK